VLAPAPPPTFRRIWSDHGPYVGRALRHLGVRDADLDDALQEVFIVVHRRLPELRDADALRSWLYGIALRIAMASRRRSKQRAAREGEVADYESIAHSESGASSVETQQTANALLERLDDDRRAVFVLYHVEQMSMREVAEIVGAPLQTCYSRLRAAHRVLEDAAAEEGRG
jgi:RNA polymerase sigma-70 factor (ECF subfamily)